MKGRRTPGGNLDGFMRDYQAATLEHPLNRRARVWIVSEASKEHYIATEIRPFDGKIHIGDFINSVARGAGHASFVLKRICTLADQHRVALDLFPVPCGQGGLGVDALIAWYKRYGFRGDEDVGMVRQPQRAKP